MLNTRRFPSEGPHSDALGPGSYKHEMELASRYQAAAAELGQIALESTTLDTLYKIVATRLGQLLGVDRVAIMEVEEDRRLVLKAGTGWGPGQTGCVIAEWDAATPHAYPPVLRGPIVDEWLGTPPRPQGIMPGDDPAVVGAQTVPVGRYDRPAGAIGVYTTGQRQFAEQELILLKSVAQVLASAIDRAHRDERIRQQSAESAILGEIARIMGSSLEIEEVYPLFARQVARLIHFDRITISTIDSQSGTHRSAYTSGTPVEEWDAGVQQKIDGRAIEAPVKTRSGTIVQDENLADFKLKYPIADIGASAGLRSMLTVPVIWQGEVINLLVLRSKQVNAYRQRDLQLAERVAAQIAGGLANSKLHQAQRAYAQEQATLAEISRVITSSVKLEEIYPRFAACVRKLVPFDRIGIITIDEESSTVLVRYVWGKEFPESGVMENRPMQGTATAAVVAARTGLIITPEQILSGRDRFRFLAIGLRHGLKSTLVVPLVYRGKVIGSLMLRSTQPDAYSLRDLRLMERVGLQISGTVWNALLNAQLEESVRQQALLAELSAATIQARDIDTVLEKLHEVLAQCIRFDRIVVGLHDVERSTVRNVFVRGIEIEGLGQGVVVQRPPHAVGGLWSDFLGAHCGGASREGLEAPELTAEFTRARLHSWLQAPLKSGDHLIGMISLRSVRKNAYTPADLLLLERIAAQVAPAMDNARFYQHAQEDALQRSMLENMFRVIGEQSDTHELVRSFVSQLRRSIPADSISISAADLALEPLAAEFNRSSHGEDGLPLELRAVNEKIAARVAGSRRALAMSDRQADSHVDSADTDFAPLLAAYGYHSSLSVPLFSARSVVAVLHFHSGGSQAYSDRMRSMAEQAGALLMNAIGPLQPVTHQPADGKAGLHAPAAGEQDRILPVVLVDARRDCRHATRVVMRTAGVNVLAGTHSLADAARLVKSRGARTVLWEVHEGEEISFGEVRSLRDACPEAKVIIVDNGFGPGGMGEAVRAGANGYLLKESDPEKMARLLFRAAAGEIVLDSSAVSGFFAGDGTPGHGLSPEDAARVQQLSERDRAILQAVAAGRSNAEIAEQMNFAVGTIKNRLARIYRVFGVSDRAAAMAFAIRAGIVS